MTADTHTFHDPLREAQEFREQVGSPKRRLVFFFGAGTSQAVGIDGVVQLTKRIGEELPNSDKPVYARLLKEAGPSATVESVLDNIRLCRELLGSDENREVNGLKCAGAASLDRGICRLICKAVKVDPPGTLRFHTAFAGWLKSVDREQPIEIFTTNYDLVLERGMEAAETPHFDGFIGSVAPYFVPATVEASIGQPHPLCPPRTWVRIWKLHGSIGWRLVANPLSGQKRIVRTPAAEVGADDDLMIFPSRQKYMDSRKQPYVAYHDRFRRLLSSGEVLLVIAGYSFGDQHIDEVILEALRANNRLAVSAFMFEELSDGRIQDDLLKHARMLRNLTVYGPDQACVGGILAPWSDPNQPAPAWLGDWPFWDRKCKRFVLGDFLAFVNFLQEFLGTRDPLVGLEQQVARPAPAAPPSTATPGAAGS